MSKLKQSRYQLKKIDNHQICQRLRIDGWDKDTYQCPKLALRCIARKCSLPSPGCLRGCTTVTEQNPTTGHLVLHIEGLDLWCGQRAHDWPVQQEALGQRGSRHHLGVGIGWDGTMAWHGNLLIGASKQWGSPRTSRWLTSRKDQPDKVGSWRLKKKEITRASETQAFRILWFCFLKAMSHLWYLTDSMLHRSILHPVDTHLWCGIASAVPHWPQILGFSANKSLQKGQVILASRIPHTKGISQCPVPPPILW